MAEEPNLRRNQMVLQASGIFIALSHMPIAIRLASYSKNPKTLQNGMLIRVETDLPEVIVHLDQTAILPPKERKEGG